jgi:hypothetical protein
MDTPRKRGELIQKLEEALAISEELHDAETGYLIERALDQARSQLFTPLPPSGVK